MIAIGIDPGASGGIAIAQKVDGIARVVDVEKYGQPVLMLSYLQRALAEYPKAKIAIEEVHGRGGWHASALFSFGHNLGTWDAILSIAEVSSLVMRVQPQQWQNDLFSKTFRGDKSALANQSNQFFEFNNPRRLFRPNFTIAPGQIRKVPDALADAVLIAVWALDFEPGSTNSKTKKRTKKSSVKK